MLVVSGLVVSGLPSLTPASAADSRWYSWKLGELGGAPDEAVSAAFVSPNAQLVGFVFREVAKNRLDERLVFRSSSDRGRSWRRRTLGSNPRGYWSVATSRNGRTIAVGWLQGGPARDSALTPTLSVSRDAGESWRHSSLREDAARLDDPQVRVSADGRRIVAAAGFSNRGAHGVAMKASTDNGRSWSSRNRVTQGPVSALDLSADGHSLAVGYTERNRARAAYTDDLGRSWTTRALGPANQKSESTNVSVSADGDTMTFAWQTVPDDADAPGAKPTPWIDIRSSADWVSRSGPTGGSYMAISEDGRTVLASGAFGIGSSLKPAWVVQVWRTSDGGKTWAMPFEWTSFGGGYGSPYYATSLHVGAGGRQLAFAKCDFVQHRAAAVVTSADAGHTWREQPNAGPLCYLAAGVDGHLAAPASGGLLTSPDAGGSWSDSVIKGISYSHDDLLDWQNRASPVVAANPRFSVLAYTWPGRGNQVFGALNLPVRKSRLRVSARAEKSSLRAGKWRTAVSRVNSNAKVSIRPKCLKKGKVLKGAAKRKSCQFQVDKKQGSVKVRPSSAKGITVRVTIVAEDVALSRSKWQRTWGVRG